VTTFQGVTDNSTTGFVSDYVSMCWNRDPLAIVNRPYLAATFPAMGVLLPSSGQSSNMAVSNSENLAFSDYGLASYTLQSGQPPTSMAANLWQWNTNTTVGDQVGPNVVYAANLFQLQQDNHNVFLSGIFLGIAGGALIALVQELLTAARRGDEQH
jgi:hypothetical protein